MNVTDAIAFFQRQQMEILAQYQQGIANLTSDRETLTRLMLKLTEGLRFIEQGNIVTRCQTANAITLASPNNYWLNAANPLTVRRISLSGAKRLHIGSQMWNDDGTFTDLLPFDILIFLSQSPNENVRLDNFAKFGTTRMFQSAGALGEVDIAGSFDGTPQGDATGSVNGTINQNGTVNLITGASSSTGPIVDGSLDVTLPHYSGSVSMEGSIQAGAAGAIYLDFYGEIPCAGAEYAYVVHPIPNGNDGFIVNGYPNSTYTLLG